MEHIEEVGIHSGDSACVIPPFSLSMAMHDRIRDDGQFEDPEQLKEMDRRRAEFVKTQRSKAQD